MPFQQSVSSLIYAIVLTIPLLFGAVHPIVLGCYVALMLVGCGGWLLLNLNRLDLTLPSFWLVVPLLLVIFIIGQSIPLPLDWVEAISPYRAERVRMVNELAGTQQQFIAISDNGRGGFYRSFFLISLILYYLTLRQLLAVRKKFFFTLILCLVSVGTFEALYGLMQFINPNLGILWLSITSRAAYGTIIYKNQYASLLNMIWPLAIAGGALYFFKRSQGRRHLYSGSKLKIMANRVSTTKIQSPLLIFAAMTMVLAILFSLSRGGILAMLLVALCLIVLLPFSKNGKIGFLALFLCLIVGYASLLDIDTLIARFGSIDTSGQSRIDLYLSSLPMLLDHWLTGIGFGSYSLLSPVYLKGFPEHIHYDKAHNEYLELLIELGIPVALLLFGWMIFGMIKLLLGLLSVINNPKVDRKKVVFGIAAFCGLIGFLIHGIVDFGWRLPANLVYSITLLALCVESTKVAPLPTRQSED
jgi:O-antigen ligase